jgi:hypothetical protein
MIVIVVFHLPDCGSIPEGHDGNTTVPGRKDGGIGKDVFASIPVWEGLNPKNVIPLRATWHTALHCDDG